MLNRVTSINTAFLDALWPLSDRRNVNPSKVGLRPDLITSHTIWKSESSSTNMPCSKKLNNRTTAVPYIRSPAINNNPFGDTSKSSVWNSLEVQTSISVVRPLHRAPECPIVSTGRANSVCSGIYNNRNTDTSSEKDSSAFVVATSKTSAGGLLSRILATKNPNNFSISGDKFMLNPNLQQRNDSVGRSASPKRKLSRTTNMSHFMAGEQKANNPTSYHVTAVSTEAPQIRPFPLQKSATIDHVSIEDSGRTQTYTRAVEHHNSNKPSHSNLPASTNHIHISSELAQEPYYQFNTDGTLVHRNATMQHPDSMSTPLSPRQTTITAINPLNSTIQHSTDYTSHKTWEPLPLPTELRKNAKKPNNHNSSNSSTSGISSADDPVTPRMVQIDRSGHFYISYGDSPGEPAVELNSGPGETAADVWQPQDSELHRRNNSSDVNSDCARIIYRQRPENDRPGDVNLVPPASKTDHRNNFDRSIVDHKSWSSRSYRPMPDPHRFPGSPQIRRLEVSRLDRPYASGDDLPRINPTLYLAQYRDSQTFKPHQFKPYFATAPPKPPRTFHGERMTVKESEVL